MSVIGHPVRPAASNTLLPQSKKSISSDAYTKDKGQVSLTNSSTHGNGHLLQLLDSQSRHRTVNGLGEEAAQHGTDVATSEFGSFSNKLGASVIALASVKTAIDTDASGTQATDSAIASDSSGLEIAKSAMKDNLTQLATDPKAFHEAIKMSFGESYGQTKAEAIRVQVLEDDFSWMPDIKVVDKSVLTEQTGSQGEGQGLGAYSADTDTIYISAQLVQSDPDKTLQILTEEVGHGLDARLNTTDAAGDEGDIFARLVGGEEISDSELSALKQENDSGTIIVDGKEVEVEFGWLKKLRRKAKKAFKKVAKVVTAPFRAAKKVASKAWSGVKKGFKKVMQSKLLGTVMTLAQFVPIPMVQMAVRVYNVAKAGYATYQGVKHGSISMVLSGAAGVVGGVGKIGGMMGASSKFVERAAGISSKITTASAIHKTISEKNFAAAAGLASNYFGGSDTKLGNVFGTAKNAADTVENVENTVKAVKQTVAAVQAGDVNGVLMGASSVYTIGNGALESGKATQSGLINLQQFSDEPHPAAVGSAISNGARTVGGAISDGVRAVGSVISDGARAVGGAIRDGVNSVGGAISSGIRSVGNFLSDGVNLVGDLATNGLDFVNERVVSPVLNRIPVVGPWLNDHIVQPAFGLADTTVHFTTNVFDSAIDFGNNALAGGVDIATNLLSGDLRGAWQSTVETARTLGQDMVGFVIESAVLPAKGITGAINDAFNLAETRGLRPEERTYLETIYGNSLDYDAIRIQQGGGVESWIPRLRPHAVGNEIYMSERSFNPDGSLTPAGLDLLAHESGHVWQFQTDGASYIGDAVISYVVDQPGAYDFTTAIEQQIPWDEMTPDQQAEIAMVIGEAIEQDATGSLSAIALREAIDRHNGPDRGIADLTNQQITYLQNIHQILRTG